MATLDPPQQNELFEATKQPECTTPRVVDQELWKLCSGPMYPNDAGRVLELLRAGADVNLRGPYGKTALIEAAYHQNWQACRELLAMGADVNLTSDSGSTALGEWARAGNVQMCEMLLDLGARHECSHFLLPIQRAAQFGHTACCELLVRRGVDPDAVAARADGHVERTALGQAAEGRHRETFLALLALGADPRKARSRLAVNWAEMQRALEWPLHYSAQHGATAACLSLLERGWELAERNGSKLTAVQLATKNGYPHTAEAMLAWKAQREARAVMAVSMDAFRAP